MIVKGIIIIFVLICLHNLGQYTCMCGIFDSFCFPKSVLAGVEVKH